jgi:hypothetical protein
VVQIGGRPAYHLAVRNARGARSDLWYFIEGRHGLRLEVVQAGDVPERWRSVPSRIAAGVEFHHAR